MFDFKKEYKEFYLPKNVPSLVTVPDANFLAVPDTKKSIMFSTFPW